MRELLQRDAESDIQGLVAVGCLEATSPADLPRAFRVRLRRDHARRPFFSRDRQSSKKFQEVSRSLEVMWWRGEILRGEETTWQFETSSRLAPKARQEGISIIQDLALGF